MKLDGDQVRLQGHGVPGREGNVYLYFRKGHCALGRKKQNEASIRTRWMSVQHDVPGYPPSS
jgi:hypothetical protein